MIACLFFAVCFFETPMTPLSFKRFIDKLEGPMTISIDIDIPGGYPALRPDEEAYRRLGQLYEQLEARHWLV